METTAVSCETLVERDRVTLVVLSSRGEGRLPVFLQMRNTAHLPVGNAGRDHPVLLLLRGDFPRRAAKDGRRRRGRTARDLLALELGRLERIFNDLNLREEGFRLRSGPAE